MQELEKIDTLEKYKKYISTTHDYKPTILVHACCAPCSSEVLNEISKAFDITIYYYNPNTYPKNEYDKRFHEFSKLPYDFKIINETYDENEYLEKVGDVTGLKEGSIRCYNCYDLRIERAARKAKELGFDYFTTTLSISPYKRSKWINELGLKYQEKYGINFLYYDFKKNDGYKKSIVLSHEYDLYRQEYCGCRYSLDEQEEKKRKKLEEEAK